MIIALIDYGAGNLHSVHNALRKAGADDVTITADADVVAKADRIVLPGVGAFRACRDALVAIPGMVDAMNEAVNQHPLSGRLRRHAVARRRRRGVRPA
jgi:imidazole glycerol-phosphate synthase subunit HisH